MFVFSTISGLHNKKHQDLLTRAAYWSEVQKFTQSVISGLIWYIQVSLLHDGLITDDITTDMSERIKVPQSLLPYLFSEASRIFTLCYQEKNLYEFFLLDCQVNPHFNGCRGQITSFNHQNGQYSVTLQTSIQVSCASTSSSIVMQLYPHYMEPITKFKKFGIKKIKSMQCEEIIVSLPNHFYVSDSSSPTLQIKFYPRLFELMRKRYIRPETAQNSISIEALRTELTKMDEESCGKVDECRHMRMEYTAHQYNISSFIFPFRVNDRSLFQSGRNLSYFSLDTNTETMDDLLDTVFRQEGSIKLQSSSFDSLIPGHLLDSKIIDLCLKW